jgi:hypothetical protein
MTDFRVIKHITPLSTLAVKGRGVMCLGLYYGGGYLVKPNHELNFNIISCKSKKICLPLQAD